MTTAALLRIGEVAENTGVSVSAVRYYDDIGVISSATRVGGKRRFAPATVGRVSFIRRAQDAGFTLDQIRTLLDESDIEWRSLVDDKIEELVDRRERLSVMIDMLAEMRECGCDVVASCPQLATC